MPSSPKAKSKMLLIAGCLVILLLAFSIYLLRPGAYAFPESGASAISTSDTATPAITDTPTSVIPTSTPTATPTVDPYHYTTIKTFNGAGSQKTPLFDAPFDAKNHWRISWICTGGSLMFMLHYLDHGIDVPVGSGNSFASSDMPSSGDEYVYNLSGQRFYLDITASSSWTVYIEQGSLK